MAKYRPLDNPRRIQRRKDLKASRLNRGLCKNCGLEPVRPGKNTGFQCALKASKKYQEKKQATR